MQRSNYRGLDITGERYGKLVAIEKVPNKRTTWLFKCDCGNTVQLHISKVFRGQLSCGCLGREFKKRFAENLTTHGESKTKLYHKYRSILDRCYRADNRNYKRYGGRGIYVCDEWRNDFAAFRDWAYSTGYNPELDGNTEQSIDRIDNNGPYSPENCRWATALEQQKNREITTLYEFNGEEITASEFADRYGIKDKCFVYGRLKRGRTLYNVLYEWQCANKLPDNLQECSEVAKQLGITEASVKRKINGVEIKGQKIGRKWYVIKHGY